MPEKIDIDDEYTAAAKVLGVEYPANRDQIDRAYKAQLEQSAGNAQREEELLHAKGILTGSVQPKDQFGRFWTYVKRQLNNPAHSERPPTVSERVRTAGPQGLFSFAASYLNSLQSGKKQFIDPSQIGSSNPTISDRIQENLAKGKPTRSIWSYLTSGSPGEDPPGKGIRR